MHSKNYSNKAQEQRKIKIGIKSLANENRCFIALKTHLKSIFQKQGENKMLKSLKIKLLIKQTESIQKLNFLDFDLKQYQRALKRINKLLKRAKKLQASTMQQARCIDDVLYCLSHIKHYGW